MLSTQLKTSPWAYLSIHRGGSHYPPVSTFSSSSLPPTERPSSRFHPTRKQELFVHNPSLRVCSVDFLRFYWCYGPLIRGLADLGRRRSCGRRRSGGEEMAGGKEPIEVRFRLFDGTDIGPSKYDPSTTVSALKEFILARWPQDKDIAPKTVNDLKLINAGRILENNRTLAESRVPVGEVPGSVITMHVVVRPPQAEKNSEKRLANSPKQNRCGCTIL